MEWRQWLQCRSNDGFFFLKYMLEKLSTKSKLDRYLRIRATITPFKSKIINPLYVQTFSLVILQVCN